LNDSTFSLVALAVFLIVVLVEPTWRVKRQTGELPIVFRRSSPLAQRLVGLMFLVGMLGLLGWSVAVATGTVERWSVPRIFGSLGWVFVLAGFVIALLGQRTMGNSWRVGIPNGRTDLVTHGIFGWIRNPVFMGIMTAVAGFAAITPGWPSVLLVVLLVVTILVQVRFEERHLLRVVGDPYAEYGGRVGRFIPGVGKLRPG
jgi:protein-S-isoprenylcysteine O-methyltransferase Ste14